MRTLDEQALGSLEARVRGALARVPDPEIPTCSIVDLGMVERVRVSERKVEVDLLPTFSGCPAPDVIHRDAVEAVRRVAGERETRVRFVYSPAWTTDRVTAAGREALRGYGVTPPTEGGPKVAFIPLAAVRSTHGVVCPFCGGEDTELESAFGPTLCRSIHFCRSCRNPFESFKTKRPG